MESLTSAVCAFGLVLSYALHTQTPTAGGQGFIRVGMCMLHVLHCKNINCELDNHILQEFSEVLMSL